MLLARALIVSLVFGILTVPLVADAQQAGKVYRIGHLGLFGAPAAYYEPFWQRLRELGYVYYKNVVMTRRTAWDNSSLQNFAAELVRLEVDLIFADSTLAALAARNATSAIPIVMIAGDPVRAGLVLSLARPGGNVTGFASLTSDLNAKRLELLKEASPRVSRVAVLWDPADPGGAPTVKEMQGAARALGVSLLSVAMRGPEDFQNAFAAVIKDQADALVITPDWDPLGDPRFQPILRFPVERRLPAMYSGRAFVDAGGLMSYGVSFPDLWRRAAAYVDKILKGAKPADLPVEQPTRFELVINMKTAKALGLTIPQSILIRADKVIE